MRKQVRGLGLALLIAALCVVGYCLKESIAGEKVIMEYGQSSEPDGTFDATRWFENGMYKRRRVSWLPDFATNSMMRVSLPPFHFSQVEDLRHWLVVWVNEFLLSWPKRVPSQKDRFAHIPESKVRETLLDERFDPRSQIIYRYSVFWEIDKPTDVYTVYLLIEGQRFYANMEIDGVSGKIQYGWANDTGAMSVSSVTNDLIFAEIEARQKRIGEKPSDPRRMPTWVPPGVPKDMACPQAGWWWAPPDPDDSVEPDAVAPPVRRYFQKGEIMPSPFPEDAREWAAAWLWSEKQTP
jgi:hypothetical protein